MLDYIKKYQAGGQIDTDTMRQSIKDDEDFYKEGKFTSAGKKRLKAIDSIETNQKNGITYLIDKESNTFKTVDKDGEEVQVEDGRGRGVKDTGRFYGTVSQKKGIRKEVSNVIADAVRSDSMLKPRTEVTAERVDHISPPSVFEVESKKLAATPYINMEDSEWDGITKSLADYKPEVKEPKKLVSKFATYEQDYNPTGSTVQSVNPITTIVQGNAAKGGTTTGTGTDVTTGKGGEKPAEGKDGEVKETKQSILERLSGNNIDTLKRIDETVENNMYGGSNTFFVRDPYNDKKNNYNKAVETYERMIDPGKRTKDETAKLTTAYNAVGKNSGTDLEQFIQQRYLDGKNKAYEELEAYKKDFYLDKLNESAYFLSQKAEESKDWIYDRTDDNFDSQAAVWSLLNSKRQGIADIHGKISKEGISNEEFEKLFFGADTPALNPNTKYSGSDVHKDKEYYKVKPGPRPANIKTIKSTDDNYWDHYEYLGTMYMKNGGKLVTKHQSGKNVMDPETAELINFIKSNYGNTNKAVVETTEDETSLDNKGGSFSDTTEYDSWEDKLKSLLKKTGEGIDNTLGKTGINTPIGQVQYNDIGQFILATIARNQKVDEIKPFYETYQSTGSRDVLAARDIDASMLTERENQITNIRPQYSGSDPVMNLIAGQMAESQRSLMKDQLLTARGDYIRGEEDRVAQQTEEKRQQMVTDLVGLNAANNRNAERSMAYDTAKAQENQRRESEYFNNLGTQMAEIQGRANLNASKKRDLIMGLEAQQRQQNIAAETTRNKSLSDAIETSGWRKGQEMSEWRRRNPNATSEEYNKWSKEYDDTSGITKLKTDYNKSSETLKKYNNVNVNDIYDEYNDLARNQKLIQR